MGKQIRIGIFIVFNLLTLNLWAHHQVGTEFTYTCVGKDSFLLKLNYYQECDSTFIPENKQAVVIDNKCQPAFTDSLVLTGSPKDITPLCPNSTSPCAGTSVLSFGVELYTYEKLLILPDSSQLTDSCGIWKISWEGGCRDWQVDNEQYNNFLEITINQTDAPGNSSPQFILPPVPYVCANLVQNLNTSAVDANGDSLSFSLVPCRTGSSKGDTLPLFSGNHSKQPFQTVQPLGLDKERGTMYFTPLGTQIAYYCIEISEFRNGKKIGSVVRDYALLVMDPNFCNNPPPDLWVNGLADFDTAICPGQAVSFSIHTSDMNQFQQVDLVIPDFPQPPNNNHYDSAHIFFQPPTNGHYHFPFQAIDNGCPVPGITAESVYVNVADPEIKVGTTTICDFMGDTLKPWTSVGFDSIVWHDTAGNQYLGKNIFVHPATDMTYHVYATNGHCDAYDTGYVLTGTTPVITLTGNDANGTNCDGTASVIDNSGVATSFEWSNGDTATSLTNLCAGVYYVTISDEHGCSIVDSVVIEGGVGVSGPFEKLQMSVQPNPANDLVLVTFNRPLSPNGIVELINPMGKTVRQVKMENATAELDVKELPQGLYFIRYSNEQKQVIKKLILL